MNPAARLYMIYQETELIDEIKSLLKEKSVLYEAVKLIGKIPHEDMMYWYSAADFYISGSHKEGSGYSLLEAMACGCPVICSNTSSIPEVVGDAAELFDPHDLESAERALQGIAKDADRAILITNGITRASRFSDRIMARRTVELYKTLDD